MFSHNALDPRDSYEDALEISAWIVICLCGGVWACGYLGVWVCRCYRSAVSRLDELLLRVEARGHDTTQEVFTYACVYVYWGVHKYNIYNTPRHAARWSNMYLNSLMNTSVCVYCIYIRVFVCRHIQCLQNTQRTCTEEVFKYVCVYLRSCMKNSPGIVPSRSQGV